MLKLDSSGDFVWAKSFLGDSGGLDFGGIAVDGSGNSYITGQFTGTVDFDPGAGTTYLTPAGYVDVYVLRLDSSGDLVWAKSVGGSDYDTGDGIAVDGSGNSYITGQFTGTVDFDPGAGTTYLTSAGYRDEYVLKLDSSGDLVWAKSVGGSLYDNGGGIAVDGSGNSYITGRFQLTVDFDPGAGTNYLTSAGVYDAHVLKLDSSGDFVWAKSFGGSDWDAGEGIAVDGSGNSYTTGYFQGTVDFDPGVGTTYLTSAGHGDVYVLKLDSSGDLVWAKSVGGASWEAGYAIVAELFHSVLEEKFPGVFRHIVFAITDWSDDDKFIGPFIQVFHSDAKE